MSAISTPSSFKSSVHITHIGTATAIIDIDGIRFLTDPAFDPTGSEYPINEQITLKNEVGPALTIDQLPHIDAVLLSHEDHPDNLDTLGRTLLEGRKVYTTQDGAKNLSPRPNVLGFDNWESREVTIGDKTFRITATPTKHLEGGECVGFILETDSFGSDPTTHLPNAIWFSGDTVVIPEFQKIKEKWHVVVAVLNLGDAHADPESQITMSGQEGAKLCEDLRVDVMVPMHFDGWGHFSQHGPELKKALEGVSYKDHVKWLELGKAVKVV